jgi:rod shape-determining protein MreC
MQPLFQQGAAITLRVILFVALSLGIMTADQRYHHMDAFRSALGVVVYPLQYLVHLPARFATWLADTISTHNELVDEIRLLKQREFRLQARLQKLEVLETENERLRKLLRSSSKVDAKVLIAELLSVDLDPYRQQVLINKGERDGVFVGEPIIDAHGIIGQVVHSGPFSSTALLISDPNHALPVQINRNGLRTIAAGTGNPDQLELLYIPNNADIIVGDKVITSGLGGRFPPDYPVAVVTDVKRAPGQAFAEVFARPAGLLDRSREVLLVGPRPPAEPEQDRENEQVAPQQSATDEQQPPADPSE